MSDWSMLGGGQDYATGGRVAASTDGTIVSTAGPGGTLSPVTIVAATGIPFHGIFVHVHHGTVGGSVSVGGHFILNILVGPASSEEILIPGILLSSAGQVSGGEAWICQTFFFPVEVPTGTRLSATLQSTTDGSTANSLYVSITGFAQDTLPSSPSGFVDNGGVYYPANEGTQITSGVANTKGNYVVLLNGAQASYSRALVVAVKDKPPASDEVWLVDIARGISGSEVVILPGMPFKIDAATGRVSQAVIGPIPFHLPYGEIISARGQSNNSSATLTLAMYLIAS